MSDHDKDDLDGVEALPVYDRVTSKFMWIRKPSPAPSKPGTLTYGIEVSDEDGNPMPFVANGVWVRHTPGK